MSSSIDIVGIPTFHRPDSLQRCLSSYQSHSAARGGEVRYCVVDNSTDPGVRQTNLEVVESVSRNEGAHIRYVDRLEREAYTRRLAIESGVSEAVIRFALLGDVRCTHFLWDL